MKKVKLNLIFFREQANSMRRSIIPLNQVAAQPVGTEVTAAAATAAPAQAVVGEGRASSEERAQVAQEEDDETTLCMEFCSHTLITTQIAGDRPRTTNPDHR